MISHDLNLDILVSSLINDSGYFSGFGTIQLGDGRHLDNILRFFNQNNISYKKIVLPEQIHSTNVEIYTATNKDNFEKISDTDGLVTKENKTVLTVVTADCSPIIFVDKKNDIIAVSHQGWRGSVKRMVQKVVDKMVTVGADVKNIKAAIGPTIGQCCYTIDNDRYYEFKDEFDGYSEKIFNFHKGNWYLNLCRLNYMLLIEKGVLPENIDYFPFCTKCDKKRFFSYRRDKKTGGYGEMFSFIMKT